MSDVFKEGIVRKLIKILPVLWFVCGLAFAAASVFGYRQLLSSSDNAKLMTHPIQTKEQTKQQLDTKNDYANFDPNQIKPVNANDYANAQLHYEGIVNHWGIGSIFIPSAKVQSKILAGMSNQNLMVGVGTYYPDQRLGKGNYVLLAHNLIESGGALGGVLNTKINHVIYATDFTSIFEYVATKNGIVNQDNGELLDKPAENKTPLITLFRCEGGLNTSKRALVQGDFVRSYPINEASDEVKVGLGLGVMTENIESNTMTDQSNSQQEQQQKSFSKKQFKQKKPTYSLLEKFAIKCFSTVSKYPLYIGSGFLLILILLQRISKKFY